MGVPKFFRWMSERYPLCSQLIADNNIPVFDNLFLDMNGIIHNCSHGNNDDVHMRISQDKIFINIFTYVSHLFATIKPRKLFFMAIDGVAPRAKINQQRSRRFRTAFEAEEGVRKALLRGEELPEEPAFDSNCITPGTEFMDLLTSQLKYFINKKLHEDPTWRDCTIVLSGPDVPGEGEHKIMEYIRLSRSQPDYNPNTRHCLYGLDADLIMLGLLSHDPHFCLLREEVVFGAQQRSQRIQSVEEQKFYLMHLSILREYLEKEFLSVQPALSFQFDVERLIDDFILMALFVGNDFLPHLPDLHINEGALTLMFDLYKRALPSMGGYMNEHGLVKFDRLEKLLVLLADWEKEKFSELHPSASKHKSQQKSRKVLSTVQARFLETVKAFLADGIMSSVAVSTDMQEDDLRFIKRLAKELGLITHLDVRNQVLQISRITYENEDGDQQSEDESHLAQMRVLKKYSSFAVSDENTSASSQQDQISIDFQNSKQEYYREKLQINEPADLKKFLGYYAQGLQWVMDYYYNGVQSWNWFFPYHYAPKISDLVPGIRSFYEEMPPFELGEPFNPFEQLLAVLPSRSKMLLPEPLRDLMYDKSSPILDFYPLELDTDLNGKKNDWEAVVKIPFIDEKRLLDAMRPRIGVIPTHDKARMLFGESWTFRYDPNFSFHLHSTIPGILPDIIYCNTRMQVFHLPIVRGKLNLRKSILPSVNLGAKALPGFPSLKTIEHTSQIFRAGIKVFQADSRNDSVIITIENKFLGQSIDEIASSLLGSKIFVNWPYLQDAILVKISDQSFEYILDPDYSTAVYAVPRPVRVHKIPQADVDKWHRLAERLESNYQHYKGISTGAVQAIIHVAPLKGMKRLDNGAIVKEYQKSFELKEFPLHTLVEKVEIEDDRYVEKPPPPIEQEFPMGCYGFYLGEAENELFGAHVQVTGHSKKRLNLRIANAHLVPVFAPEILKRYEEENNYLNLPALAKQLGVSPMSLSRITSSVYVISESGSKIDIGLRLKFEGRQQKVIGYTRRSDRGWEFSQKAVDLIREYHESFPAILRCISKPGADDINASLIFPKDTEVELKRLQSWLSSKKIKDFRSVTLEVDMLSPQLTQELEQLIDDMKTSTEGIDRALLDIPAQFILLPSQAIYRLTNRQRFKIGDRVVFVPDSGAGGVVVSGAVGTVVGIEASQSSRPEKRGRDAKSDDSAGNWIHVLLDIRTVGAGTLDGICSPGRGITVRSTCLLNLTDHQPPVHRRSAGYRSEFIPTQAQSAYRPKGGRPISADSVASNGGDVKTKPIEIMQRIHGSKNHKQSNQNVWAKRENQRQILTVLKSTPRPQLAVKKSVMTSAALLAEADDASSQLKTLLNIGSCSRDEIKSPPAPLVASAAQQAPETAPLPPPVPAWILANLPTSVIAARSINQPSKERK